MMRAVVGLSLVVTWVIVLLFVLLAVSSAWAHDWYTTQKTAGGVSCCGGYDCGEIPEGAAVCDALGCDVTLKPGEHVMWPESATGAVTLRFVGSPKTSPDGRNHACITKASLSRGAVFCLFLGGLI